METNSISTLRAIDVSSMANHTMVSVKGYYTPGDGGGGAFIYLSSGTQTDNGGTFIEPASGSGVWKRVYDSSINIKWFGALPTSEMIPLGLNGNLHQYIQNAINFVHAEPGYGEVLIPPGWYKLDGNIVSYADITLKGMGNTYFFRQGTLSSETYFFTINPAIDPANWIHSKVALDGVIFAGDESFDGTPSFSYKANLVALRILANSFHINNCAFYGFDKTTKFESNSYLISFNSCSFRQNNYGFHYDYTSGMTNSGENIKILDSVIAGNHYGIYNKWAGLFVNNCSIDYNVVHIADVISKSGGVVTAPTIIDNCHFETTTSISSDNFRINNSSSGVLFIQNSFFYDNSHKLFNNGGHLVLTNNTYLPEDGKYLVSGSGLVIEETNIARANAEIARINKMTSGIRNGSFDRDLAEGWSFSAGSNAATTTAYTYDSQKALKISPTSTFTGTYLISDFIPVPADRLGYILSCFVTNSNHPGAIHVHYYDRDQTVLSNVYESTGLTTVPARIKIQYAFPERAAFMRIEIRCPNGDPATQAIYIDDFYLSFLLVP